MTTPFSSLESRNFDGSLPTCGEIYCSSHGSCVVSPDDGVDVVCTCNLGYQGQFCEETVNGALSLPLTLSVLFVIVGLLILAIIVAKMRQRQKKERRRIMAAKHGYNVVI